MQLPQDLLDADTALHAIHLRLAASRHLNPLDEVEAHARFLAGAPASFRYATLTDADELLRACDAVSPPLDHPLGREVAAAVEELRLSVLALRDRTALAFERLGVAAGWFEGAEAPTGSPPRVRKPDEEVLALTVVLDRFRSALQARGFDRWRVEADPVMSARVVADAPRRLLRINPRATISPTDMEALVAHEVGVHVARAEAGAAQPLRLFSLGLAGSLVAEEGLALHAEAEACGLPVGASDRLALLAAAARRAREQSFSGLYRGLEPLVGPRNAWTTCLRLKRGLAHPEEPGVYAKDRVYWLGWCRVSAWLASGRSTATLSVGKVGLAHPVQSWLDEGWISLPG
ncbi:MAG: DUF1704 domain-containing protein [Myxococcales bacterium]|nr:DUF1704 domain-containing protein [Myxococcales bacterium]